MSDLFQTCYESDSLLNKLIFLHNEHSRISFDSQADKQVLKNLSSDMIALGKQLQEKLNQLGHKIYQELVKKIADDFIDIQSPIRKLAELIAMPIGKIMSFQNFN
jgi:hypothetical protein